ncbi:MAG: hypothetical protein H7X94_07455 [Vallitaleaceae bacterium]|nr:hypothetical protein [Vallitaleaceae bacterium]
MERLISRIVLVITISLFIQVTVTASEKDNNGIKVLINNSEIVYDGRYGYPFVDDQDHVQVPLRLTLEKFGAKVTWNAKERTAIAQKGDIIVEIPIGQKVLYKNDEIIINESEALVIDSRTYLPIRAVMEAFGCDVTWSEIQGAVYIDFKKTLAATIITVPPTFDLRDYNKVSSVKDQKEIGACWAFSTLGAIESTLLPETVLDLSEDNLSLTHGYQVSQNQGGDFNIAMSYLARWDGPILEADDLYGDLIANNNARAVKHVQEALVLPSKNYLAIKLSLLLYGGVQTSMYFDSSIIKEGSSIFNTETSAFYYKGNAKINHAVVIIGWDDHFSKENFVVTPEADGAFICKNSYGEDFGSEGIFYVSYYDKYIGTENYVFTRIESANNYSFNYGTDRLGWVGRLGYGNDTAYFANAYTPNTKKESLRAVGFYATDQDTDYEIYLVNHFKTPLDFRNMKLIKRGSLDYKGYYTIDFDAPFVVTDKFAVVVKITTPGSNLPVAAEYYKDVDWLSEVDVSDGEGYMSQKGFIWDSTELDFNSNVCLKAFTDTIN